MKMVRQTLWQSVAELLILIKHVCFSCLVFNSQGKNTFEFSNTFASLYFGESSHRKFF